MKRRWAAKGGSHTKSVSVRAWVPEWPFHQESSAGSQHGLGAPKGSQREGRRQETQDCGSQGVFPPDTALPLPNTHHCKEHRLLPQTEVQDQAGQKL